MTNYLILGNHGARSALIAQRLPQAGDQVWLASRQRPRIEPRPDLIFHWLQVDLSERGAGALIARSYGAQPLDVCIYDAHHATQHDPAETRSVEQLTALHLTTAILCIQMLMPNLRQSRCARIVFIGPPMPTLAEPNHAQLGIRDVAQALREVVRHDSIAVTCLYMTDDLLMDGTPQCDARRDDLLLLLRCLNALSPHSVVQEIDLVSR